MALTATTIDIMQVRLYRRVAMRRQRYRCFYCLGPLDDETCTADHLVARARGGETSYENIAAACFRCNYAKGVRLPGDFLDMIEGPESGMPLEIWIIGAERRIWCATWAACDRIAAAVGCDPFF